MTTPRDRTPAPPTPPSPRVAHPPSPRALRVAAAHRETRPTAAAARVRAARAGYWVRHWRGELPLAAAVMVSLLPIAALQFGLQALQRRITLTDAPTVAASLWLIEMLVWVIGVIWWGRGVQRSAISHVNGGGSALVAALAGLTGMAAFFWVAAYLWLAARHAAPDAWATLTGAHEPAAVSISPDGATLAVRGDLEFGTTRAVRAALAAQPTLRTVSFDSRGGRVREGLALGALLRERGLDTLVLAECSSACVTAFAGGRVRLIGPDARLGLHSAGGAGATAETVAHANRESDAFIAAAGVDWRVLHKGAAVAHDDIWFPPAAVLLASNLATHYAHEVTGRAP